LALPPASRLVREFVLDIRAAQNLLVIKTIVGSAQPVAAALDEEDWPESVGTIAGDDTILIVCPDRKTPRKWRLDLRRCLPDECRHQNRSARRDWLLRSGADADLLHHPRLAKPILLRRDNATDGAANLADLFPVLSGNGSYPLQPLNWSALKRQGVQLLFLATPHETSRSLVPEQWHKACG